MGIDYINSSYNDDSNNYIIIKDKNGNPQKVYLSVFQEGMAIAADTNKALSIFDKNKDGKINKNEAEILKQSLKDNAGNDKTLDENEILKIYSQISGSKNAAGTLEHFNTMVERQAKGSLKKTVTTTDGRIITSDFNRDGSGKTIVKNRKNEIITYNYSKGKILEDRKITEADGTTTYTKYKNNTEGNAIQSETVVKTPDNKEKRSLKTYEYNENGKVYEERTIEYPETTSGTTTGKENTPELTTTKIYEYDANGNVIRTYTTNSNGKKVTAEFKNGHLIKQTTGSFKMKVTTDANEKQKVTRQEAKEIVEYSYNINGKKSIVKVHKEDTYGKSNDLVMYYNNDGEIISANRTYYKRGKKTEEKYEGANLNNRIAGSVPSETIIYEDEAKTKIKQKTVNIFDTSGILTSDRIYDGNNKLIAKHDYTKIDGKFGTAYQKNRGDCYLLSAVNAICQSQKGEKLLENTIKFDGNKYIISFPGAEIAKNNFIKKLKEKNPNFNVSKISIQKTYTVTQNELNEAMKKAGSKYSIGDKDVLLLEVAYEKYRKSVFDTLKVTGSKASDYMSGLVFEKQYTSNNDYLSGGKASEAMFVLTGRKCDAEYYAAKTKTFPICYIDSDFQMHVQNNNTTAPQQSDREHIKEDIINKLIKDSVQGKLNKYVATASFNISSQEVNGRIIEDGSHALTIKSINSQRVIMTNPWNPETEVIMSLSDFKKSCIRLQFLSTD